MSFINFIILQDDIKIAKNVQEIEMVKAELDAKNTTLCRLQGRHVSYIDFILDVFNRIDTPKGMQITDQI
jgi:hypothetical protein